MMSAPHGQPVLIRECGEIVRMRRVHHKSNKRAALFLWTKHASSWQFADALGCITRKLRVVLENRRAPDLLDVINGGCKPDSACDVWRTCFEPVRRFLERALLESDAYNHFAAAVPWRHRIENLGSSMEHADPSRSTHFVSRKRQEIATQLAHVDWHVPRALRCIDEREGAHRMRFRAEFGHWIYRAE